MQKRKTFLILGSLCVIKLINGAPTKQLESLSQRNTTIDECVDCSKSFESPLKHHIIEDDYDYDYDRDFDEFHHDDKDYPNYDINSLKVTFDNSIPFNNSIIYPPNSTTINNGTSLKLFNGTIIQIINQTTHINSTITLTTRPVETNSCWTLIPIFLIIYITASFFWFQFTAPRFYVNYKRTDEEVKKMGAGPWIRFCKKFPLAFLCTICLIPVLP